LSQTESILPALADPAAEGDHAYPVLYRVLFPKKLLMRAHLDFFGQWQGHV